MSAKIGRPKIPKNKAKAVLYGARVSPDEAKQIDKSLADSGQSQTEVIRGALQKVARQNWTVARKWSYEDLHGKSVEFKIKIPFGHDVRLAIGTGKLVTYRHRTDSKKLAVEIQVSLPEVRAMRSITLSLTQSLVDRLAPNPHPEIADFLCTEEV